MRNSIKLVRCSALILGLALAGCSTPQVDQAQLADIHSVFLKPVDDRHIEVRNPADNDWTPSASDSSLNEVVTRGGLHIGSETHSAITGALVDAGYQIATTPNTADSVVGIVIERAFYTMNPPILGGGCEPFALFDVTMTNAKTGATILSRTYRYQSGGGTGMTGHILLDAGSAHDVDDCKALWANPQISVDGFRSAESDLARALGDTIKTRPRAK